MSSVAKFFVCISSHTHCPAGLQTRSCDVLTINDDALIQKRILDFFVDKYVILLYTQQSFVLLIEGEFVTC